MNTPKITVTLVIPTYNRPSFLRRLLSHYSEQCFEHKILVADSSSEKNKITNKEIISSLPNLDILHISHYSDSIQPFYKFSDVLGYVKSEYCLFSADDDFLVPETIELCVNFLKNHKDYSVAHGTSYRVNIFPLNSARGKVVSMREFPQRSIELEKSSERLIDHLLNYTTTFYSVHRTKQLSRNFKWMLSLNNLPIQERFLSFLSIIQGKCKKIDGLYMLKQDDTGGQDESGKRRVPNKFTLRFSSPPWPPADFKSAYNYLHKCIARALAEAESMTIDEASRLISNALFAHINGRRFKPERKFIVFLRKYLKNIYIILYMWRLVQNIKKMKNIRRAKLKTQELMSPASPYYKEFIQIYKKFNRI